MTTPEVRTPGGSGRAFADQAITNTSILVDIDAVRNAGAKIKSTVIAHAALAGLAVCERADGSFVVSSWGFIKPVADLAGVMRMVRQIGGAA